MTSRRYITTAIPYVNSKPHLGFAMELVEADMMTPWTLAKAEKNGDQDATERLDVVPRTLVDAERLVADELTPFLPAAARRVASRRSSATAATN